MEKEATVETTEEVKPEPATRNSYLESRKGASRFFSVGYYALLAAGPVTMVQARSYIMGKGSNPATSKNVQNHLQHYLAIHKLIQDIREAQPAQPELPDQNYQESEISELRDQLYHYQMKQIAEDEVVKHTKAIAAYDRE